MTRLLLVLLSVGLLAGGCIGAEAKRAETLLRDAERALGEARTLHYEVDLTVKGAGVPANAAVRLRGAAKRVAGGGHDQVLRFSATGAGPDGMSGEVVVRGGRAWVRTGGRWLRAGSAGAPSTAGLERLGPDALAELAPFIEDVSVAEGRVVSGRPSAVVTCTIDTEGLLRKALESGGAAASVSGFGQMFEQLLAGVGDLDATLVLDEGTHMLRAARMSLDLEAQGQAVQLAVSLRVTGVNRPVRLPATPAG
jgi:hypothetical protein